MNDQSYSNDMARNSGAMMGFLLGAAVGAGLALLLAPASGSETRRRLGETARNLGSKVQDGVEQTKGRLGELKEKVQDSVEQTKGRLGELKEDVRTAVASGRETFNRERESRTDTASRTP